MQYDFEELANRIGEYQRKIQPEAIDGVCHLLKNGEEKYTLQLPESACAYNCDQLNRDDPTDGWTYSWNPIG